MRWRKKVYGKTMCEVLDYHTGYTYRRNGMIKQRRAKKEKPTPLMQAIHNQKQAEAKLRMLIDLNFTEEDYYITLTYEKEPTLEEAKKDIQKFIRNLKGRYKRRGHELKYIYTCEGERRIHFHVLINKVHDLTVKELKSLWKHGYSKKESYQGTYQDAVRLASYFVKESDKKLEKTGFKRKWVSSQNLQKPKVERKLLHSKDWATTITPPKGYYVETDSVREGVSLDGYPFRFYRLIKLEGGEDDDRSRRCTRRAGPRNNSWDDHDGDVEQEASTRHG